MKVTVLLFAKLADIAQSPQMVLSLPEGAYVNQLQEELIQLYPALKDVLTEAVASVNHEYAEPQHILHDGDEIAFLPPVSGGEKTKPAGIVGSNHDGTIYIANEPLQVEHFLSNVASRNAGAIVTFIGTVREITHGLRTLHLEYDSYVPMAVKKMEQIQAEIAEKWPGAKISMAHRIGHLNIEEIAVIIAVSTPHRQAAFEACKYAIERVKQMVPVWKKEQWEDGTEWQGAQEGPWKPTEPLPEKVYRFVTEKREAGDKHD